MHIRLTPGTYVVAVSGGVDSVVLLDMLQKQASLRLVVVHYDHGIRPDSAADARFVKELAEKYGLPFVGRAGKLGPAASEALARAKRYEFLEEVRRASKARSIITAHHQDDLLETAILNLLRGTGRRGLSSLRSTDQIVRPLLHKPKAALLKRAAERGLSWREDSTNQDEKYTRNYIRRQVIPKLNDYQREELLRIIRRLHDLNDEIDAHLINHLHVRLDNERLDRLWFTQLPHNIAKEIIHAWLRRHKIKDIDRKLLERIVVAAKTSKIGKHITINDQYALHVEKQSLALKHVDR